MPCRHQLRGEVNAWTLAELARGGLHRNVHGVQACPADQVHLPYQLDPRRGPSQFTRRQPGSVVGEDGVPDEEEGLRRSFVAPGMSARGDEQARREHRARDQHDGRSGRNVPLQFMRGLDDAMADCLGGT